MDKFYHLLTYLFIFAATPLIAYDYSIWQEEELPAHIDELASVEINVFRGYPYLFEGTMEGERNYLNQYLISKNSVWVVAKDGERIIGAITGLPLNEAFEECRDCFLKENLPMEKIFYLGEIVLLKEYRGQGIGVQMYTLFEQFVRENTAHQEIAFCEIVSPKDDPRRTSDYFCLDKFWTKREFVKRPHLVTQFSWKEIDNETESPHPMVFWTKKL